MEYKIKILTIEDLPYLEAMETGIEDDYVKRIFNRLVTADNQQLFGMFLNGQLVSVCGYTLFAESYAMIGRIRSDIRFRGQNLATRLTAYVVEAAFRLPNIRWVGANTQEENVAARRVLQKLGLIEHRPLFGATANNIPFVIEGAPIWRELQDINRKKEWLYRLYIKTGAVFPYECYYLFPASEALFTDEQLAKWQFFENPARNRALILKEDFKKHQYLHVIYPWSDLMEQPGLWETISAGYHNLQEQVEDEAFIWIDLSKEQAASLPEHHGFKLPSAWVLHGISRKTFNQLASHSLSAKAENN